MLSEGTPTILPLQYLKGVGPRRAEALASEGLVSYHDVVMYVPRAYVDRRTMSSIAQLRDLLRGSSEIQTADASAQFAMQKQVSLVARVARAEKKTVGKGRTMLQVDLVDDSRALLQLVFWNQISYYSKLLQPDHTFVVHGLPQFEARWNTLSMHHPELELVDEEEIEQFGTGAILPRYRITQGMANVGITMRLMRSIVDQCLEKATSELVDPLPAALVAERSLVPKAEALRSLHHPENHGIIQRAQRRMKYEELFLFELLLAARRRSRKRPERGIPMQSQSQRARALLDRLPFDLTAAQKRVIREIVADMTSGTPMNRLLQGDVGSGKTVVALLCMLNAVDNGFQTLIMAPTEILAEQHFHGIQRMLGVDHGMNVVQLVGSQRKKARASVLEQIASGNAQIVVGTHAMFESDVVYNKLGLIVIDEQHRFGVAQRAELKRLGQNSHGEMPRTPHILVMSATPIPRTLSMTLYGDLDSSVIDQLPAQRKPIKTHVVFESKMQDVFGFVRSEVALGRQAYIVYPLVERSEKIDAKSAVEHYEDLCSTVFHDLRVGLLHGQMGWNEKEDVMRAFLNRDFDILVSTTVIEVGIDVPNATVMLIENAERFGLSQLHQLRGRVGRGGEQSYCFLATKDHFKYQMNRAANAEDMAKAPIRLKTMEETTDGFRIAEVDLRLRGPGDVMGTRQSGVPDFRFADLVTDGELIAQTRADAFGVLDSDPQLRQDGHRLLRQELLRMFDESSMSSVA
jgi:ATP-dependent DNA helicase RecG